MICVNRRRLLYNLVLLKIVENFYESLNRSVNVVWRESRRQMIAFLELRQNSWQWTWMTVGLWLLMMRFYLVNIFLVWCECRDFDCMVFRWWRWRMLHNVLIVIGLNGRNRMLNWVLRFFSCCYEYGTGGWVCYGVNRILLFCRGSDFSVKAGRKIIFIYKLISMDVRTLSLQMIRMGVGFVVVMWCWCWIHRKKFIFIQWLHLFYSVLVMCMLLSAVKWNLFTNPVHCAIRF